MPSGEFCPSCGRQARESDRFCRACGFALDDSAPRETIAEAEALAEVGQLSDAISTIQRALGSRESPDLLVALSTLYLRRGTPVEARRALDRALAIDRDYAIAHAYVAGMDFHAGRVPEAKERLDHALELAPNDLIVRIKRAEFWLRLGIFDNARAELRHALQNGGGSPRNREMAETMYAAVEKRSQGSFTRKFVTLPSFGAIKGLIRRPEPSGPPAEVEV